MAEENVGNYGFVRSLEIFFTSLHSSAKSALISWLSSSGFAQTGAVHLAESSLWDNDQTDAFLIYQNAIVDRDFIVTDIILRSLGSQEAMSATGVINLIRLNGEFDTTTIQIVWGDLGLTETNKIARVGIGGGFGGDIPTDQIKIECADVRTHDIYIDVIGYYTEQLTYV